MEDRYKPIKDEKADLPKLPVQVMMADDDKDDQEIFQKALAETNIPSELTTIDSGDQLMENLKDEEVPKPDIIFLDINMPGKSGKECLAEIKKDDTLKEIPTVVYTTSTAPQDIEETYKAGANLYVPKPYSFKSLILMLRKIFTNWKEILMKPLRKAFLLSEKHVSDKAG